MKPFDTVRGISPQALLIVGVVLGVVGDALLHVGGPPGVNMSLWLSGIALAAYLVDQVAGAGQRRERSIWLAAAAFFAAGLAWRDSPMLKPLALGCVTCGFALAAYRFDAGWVRRAGVVRYVRAWFAVALHAWIAAAYALADTIRSTRANGGGSDRWRTAKAVARGLLLAAPIVAVFTALFMAADAAFDEIVRNIIRIDFEWIVEHLFLFSLCAWLSTGYLRGFLTSAELPSIAEAVGGQEVLPKRPVLAITEVATVLAVINLLFLLFVIVQFRYLFGGDLLVQFTPGLTYAEYARRGFFELVAAVALVIPILLAADWLLERKESRDVVIFRALAALQIVLVVPIMASALQRLRLYYETYGLTNDRFYAMVLLIVTGATLFWLAATVLRAARDRFAFGALVIGFATVALMFVVNPDSIIARTNVARLTSADQKVRFDVMYATTLSGDAVPVLIEALPALPPDVRCEMARHLLHRWAPDRDADLRAWNWSAARARALVREQASQLREMAGTEEKCRQE